MGVEEKLVRKRLEILLGDAEMVDSYLRTHGPQIDMTKVAYFKETRKKSLGQSTKADVGNADDPIFQVQVKCPICQTAGLECYELKAKSMAVALDRFNVPRYTPISGFKPLNFNLYAVTVCPKCLFASPDKKDFITWSMQTRSDVKSQLGPFVIEEIKNRMEQRKSMLPKGSQPGTYFAHPRAIPVAVDSYRLAIHRALIESTLDVPLAFYKVAMYQLKIALFMRDAGKDDESIIREALPNMVKAFGRIDSTNPDFEYQLLQILVAMHIRLKELEGAQSYLSVLERLKVERLKAAAENPSLKIGAVEKFVETTKALWTDRADPDLWKH